jgi:mRNA interferase MazF
VAKVTKQIPLRGQVFLADLGYGPKPWLVVSNNQRNHRLETVLVARITTTSKHEAPTIIDLRPEDPVVGRVLCDDLQQLYRDELGRGYGALCRESMARVSQGLRSALAL